MTNAYHGPFLAQIAEEWLCWFGTSIAWVNRYEGRQRHSRARKAPMVSPAPGGSASRVESALRSYVSKFIVPALVVALLPATSWATWQTFTAGDGVPGGEIRDLLEDASSNLWVAASGGLARYDALSWRRFDALDGLPGTSVKDLILDSSGRLWVATTNGMARLESDRFRAVGSADGLPDASWLELAVDSVGALWARSEGHGIARQEAGSHSWTLYSTNNGWLADNASDLLVASDGAVWSATDRGIAKFEGGSWTTYTTAATAGGLLDDVVAGLYEDRRGRVWCRTQLGVSCYDHGSWRSYGSTGGGPLAGPCADIVDDGRGNMWFATIFGVNRFDEGADRWESFSAPYPLVSDDTQRIFLDRAGYLWFTSPLARGATRFDGSTWRTFTSRDGLADDRVSFMQQDRDGNLWFGTNLPTSALTRWDNVDWRRHDSTSGLAATSVYSTFVDARGEVWCGTESGARHFDGRQWQTIDPSTVGAGRVVRAILVTSTRDLWMGTDRGAVRCRGTECRAFSTTDSLVGNNILALFEDRQGSVWIGTDRGATVSGPSGWRSYSTGSGLIDPHVRAISQSTDGAIWFATVQGASRLDVDGVWTSPEALGGLWINAVHGTLDGATWFGTDQSGVFRLEGDSWRHFDSADGLPSRGALTLLQDRTGILWCGGVGGLARFDGAQWEAYTQADGLVGNLVNALATDDRGRLWIGSGGGLTELAPDVVPPRAVFTPPPIPLSASSVQTVNAGLVLRETENIEYRFTLDGLPSAWSMNSFLITPTLGDGPHTVAVEARDRAHNVQQVPAAAAFVVDATSPVPIITSPTSQQAVSGTVSIVGRAADGLYAGHRLFLRRVGDDPWPASRVDTLGSDMAPVDNGVLATWDTGPYDDGTYELRLEVIDALGLVGAAVTPVVVDNQPPGAVQTSPALIAAARGGDVYTTHREAHLYIPPGALALDAVVELHALGADAVPEALPDSAIWTGRAYELAWGGQGLSKALVFDLVSTRLDESTRGQPALYRQDPDSRWVRIGGTNDEVSHRVAANISAAGRYGVFEGGRGAERGGMRLSRITLTPRVISPTTSYPAPDVAIGFFLGQPSTVRVAVYSRAGWLVRELQPARAVGPGSQLVRWDGRETSGQIVADGIYLVSIEAGDERAQKTVAVVH